MVAAEPLLASNIWLAQQAKDNASPPLKKQKLQSGSKAIDRALQGGLDYGQVNCLTSESDQDAADLLQAYFTTQLCSAPDATATLIDSTNALDIRRLHRSLRATLPDKQAAMAALDRAKIMKVFDYVGLTEAVGEMRDGLERRTESFLPSTIADSEEDTEDEMLDDAPPVAAGASGPRGGGLLVISSLSQLLASSLKANYTHAQALLATFLRSLAHLTRQHDLCTIVLSSAHNRPAAAELEALSQFKACTMRPALGIGIGSLVDVVLYLHSLPMKDGRERARVLEVVQDRYGMRVGLWAAYSCNADGQLADIS